MIFSNPATDSFGTDRYCLGFLSGMKRSAQLIRSRKPSSGRSGDGLEPGFSRTLSLMTT